MSKKDSIQSYLKKLSNTPGHKQRLGALAPLAGYPLIILFAVFLLPLYLYLLFFNRAYFWVRNQNPIPSAPFYNYDRHKIAHLSVMDKIWCEYCEWANGTLQWTLEVTNPPRWRSCCAPARCPPRPARRSGRRKHPSHHSICRSHSGPVRARSIRHRRRGCRSSSCWRRTGPRDS